MATLSFTLAATDRHSRARAGVIKTSRGEISTPAFIPVATRATVKSLTPEQVRELGAEAVLGNTYHLYFTPGETVVAAAGGLGRFMNWPGPTFTDSGGFQAFSLGVAYDRGLSKIGNETSLERSTSKWVKIDDDGVTFRSPLDGGEHRFTPERSLEIQRALGADIIFVLDECAAPIHRLNYQRQAMERTHLWAERSLAAHEQSDGNQSLFGIVQGGRFPELRATSARWLAARPFAGFGIGGSFEQGDLGLAIDAATAELPAEKPRHLLGIGEPLDILTGIERGMDTFDCVLPTRLARHGTLYTKRGKIHISTLTYRSDLQPIEADCSCYTCRHYSRAYLSHLSRTKEMLAATLGSIHNLHFLINLARQARQAIINNQLAELKKEFTASYGQRKV